MKSTTFLGKVAAITGAGSGIGRCLAQQLSASGCELALSDVDEAGLAQTVASLVKVTHARVDVSSGDEVRAWAQQVARDHGRVNLVFNNAGISYAATVAGADEADFRKVIDVDFWGVVHGTRAFLPLLEASGDGHVVNVSSLFGLIGYPGQSAYNAAKFAVRGFTESLRIELELMSSCVTATCVHPGGVKTNIARATKVHPSVAALGVDVDAAASEFEKMFRTTPHDAAATILSGVRKNARRVLVGGDARLLDRVQRWFPAAFQALVVMMGRRQVAKRKARS
jgi:NAD(P)-dependent dehydrogenase (short-subunit alcohol dehydrogenase family)